MKGKKIAALLLSSLLLISTAASCSSSSDAETTKANDSQPQSEGASTEAETEVWDDVPSGSYDGYNMRFLVTEEGFGYWHVDSSEQSGDVLGDAVYERNRTVEDRLGITITEESQPYSTVMDKVKSTILAGEDAYDAMTLMAYNIMTTAQENMLVDVSGLDSIDLTKPWWNSTAISDMAFGSSKFMLIGDIHLMFYESYYSIMFNKTVVEKYGIEDPYALVSDHKWTYDTMYSTASEACADLNGDGSMTPDSDSYGICMHSNAGQSMMVAMNASPISRGSDGYPQYTGLSERFVSAYEKVVTLFNDQNCTASNQTKGMNKVSGGYIQMFKEDRSLYLVEVLGTLPDLRDMESEFGVVVMPKFDESDEGYISPVYHGAIGVCIPATNSDPDRTAVILENLAAESNKTVRGVYYDVVLGSKLVRDEKSTESLDVILGGGRFEIAYVYNWGEMRGLLETNIVKDVTDIASQFAQIESQIQSQIADDAAYFA